MITSLFLATFIHTIIVDLKNFQWYAFDEDGVGIRSGQASGGRRYCPDIKRGCKTPAGVFNVISKRGRYYRSPLYPLNCGFGVGQKKCAPMPWYVKFSAQGPGFHASNDDWSRPKHQSHGCIHLRIDEAKWIHDYSTKDTVVVVLRY